MKALILCLALFTSSISFAANHHGQIGVGGVLGPVIQSPLSKDPAKKALGLGARLGAFARFNHDDPNGGFELAVDAIELLNSPMGMQIFTFSYFHRFMVEQRYQPIFALGLGASSNHNYFTTGSQDTPAVKVRLGIETALTDRMDLGVYLDHFSVFKSRDTEPNLHILAPAVVLIYNFGHVLLPEAAAPVPVAVAAAPAAPTSQKVPEIDTDNDGVFDGLDRCPGTPKGTAVNELGCALNQAFEVNLNVQFKKGTATLEAGEVADLKSIAEIMNKHKDLRLELDGYTDSSGDAAKNKALSLARAEAVKNTLILEYKVDASRLTSKGFGSASPIGSNKTAEGKAKNRRVTAKILR